MVSQELTAFPFLRFIKPFPPLLLPHAINVPSVTLLDNVNLVVWIASTFWYILKRMVWIYHPSGICHKLLVGSYGSQFLHLWYLYHKVRTLKRYLTQLLVSLSVLHKLKECRIDHGITPYLNNYDVPLCTQSPSIAPKKIVNNFLCISFSSERIWLI